MKKKIQINTEHNVYVKTCILSTVNDTVKARLLPNKLFRELLGEKQIETCTAQKMKFSIKNFFSKCDQTRCFPHLMKKSLMENFIFSAVMILRI